MRLIISTILMLTCYFNSSFSEEATINGMPLDKFKKSTLKDVLPKKTDITNTKRELAQTFGRPQRKAVVTPAYCELVHINEAQILYSYYDRVFSVTILSGYDCGLQAFYDYHGHILDGTDYWTYATVNGKRMMKHRYLDSKVYTDYDGQIIIFD